MSSVYLLCGFVILFNGVLCEIQDSNKQYEELEFWNDPRLKSRKTYQYRRFKEPNLKSSKKPISRNKERFKNGKKKVKNVTKPQKGVFRVHSQWTAQNVSWPKVAPQLRAKRVSTRVTKMMLQEAHETSTRYLPLDDVDKSEKLSPYAIKQQLSRISSKFPNTNITVDVIGRTVEYNDIVMMKISEMTNLKRHFRAEEDKYADEPPQKKIVFIVHGLSVMGMAKLECLSIDGQFTKLLSYYLTHLNNFDIFLVPLANPDGYIMAKEEIWNKNMSPQNACPGVNVDRNFDVAWNSSNIVSSCSQLYPGTAPFSEAESKAIRNVFHKYSHKIVAYIHVHAGSYSAASYKGHAVLYPKGFSEVQVDDDKYIDLKGEIDEALRNASFQTISVTVDTLYNWYGKVFGTSVDYASTIYGIPYSMELVMQLYEPYYWDTNELFEESALTEIWSRVIDVIFQNIWKNTHETDT